MTLDSKKLRNLDAKEADIIRDSVKRLPIYIILEDVLDTYNIGGFFRLADAVAASSLYICGQSATPPDTKIKKASVGAYQLVPWHYRSSSVKAISELKEIGVKIVAVEQSEKSKDYLQIDYGFPVAFVFGNESYGLSQEALSLCDDVAEIPMRGVNKSLNVMVAAGIVIYRAIEQGGL